MSEFCGLFYRYSLSNASRCSPPTKASCQRIAADSHYVSQLLRFVGTRNDKLRSYTRRDNGDGDPIIAPHTDVCFYVGGQLHPRTRLSR
jgi:hypothetical protein